MCAKILNIELTWKGELTLKHLIKMESVLLSILKNITAYRGRHTFGNCAKAKEFLSGTKN